MNGIADVLDTCNRANPVYVLGVGPLAPVVGFDPVLAQSPAGLDVFGRFPAMISGMSVVGRLLRDALPDPVSPS